MNSFVFVREASPFGRKTLLNTLTFPKFFSSTIKPSSGIFRSSILTYFPLFMRTERFFANPTPKLSPLSLKNLRFCFDEYQLSVVIACALIPHSLTMANATLR